MTDIRYELEFFSPWHCGSGMNGGNDADYVPIADGDGLPFVPGKTVKGLFREAAEALFDDREFVTRVFGFKSPHDATGDFAGSATWSNAELPPEIKAEIRRNKQAEQLRFNRYFIKIDDVDNSLRRGEFIVPMTLVGTIGDVPDADADKVIECMGFVKRLGLQRSRGFGSCAFRATGTTRRDGSAENVPVRKEYFFRCRFLTQVVLNNTGATEGVIDTLEYIPGANFLGIAARDYAGYGDEAFTVFHSGKVRFGTAYPLDSDGAATLPCPASWFIPKGGKLQDGPIFCTVEEREEHQKELQPKQVRGGYFVPGAAPRNFGTIGKSYSLKSAYDSENRRAENGKLFGYTALPAGTEWYFSLTADDDVPGETLRRVAASLIGNRRIGRSKNAQYGSVEISLLDRDPLTGIKPVAPDDGVYFIYAASPLAFLDEWGEPTLIPRVSDLGFPDAAEPEMRASQIRYFKYCPWNGARKSRDAERLVIQPGSVIAVRSQTPPDPKVIARGVGVYRSEGFGKVFCNPGFLTCRKLEKELKKSAETTKAADGDVLIDFLKRQAVEELIIRTVYAEVTNFMKECPRSISQSQWGAVRAIAVSRKNYADMMKALFEKDDADKSEIDYDRRIKNTRDAREHHPGFLRHGKMADKWGRFTDVFEKFLTNFTQKHDDIPAGRREEAARLFVELLASQMAKKGKENK